VHGDYSFCRALVAWIMALADLALRGKYGNSVDSSGLLVVGIRLCLMLLRGWTLALAGVPLLYGCYSGLVYCSGGAVWIVALVDVIALLGFFSPACILTASGQWAFAWRRSWLGISCYGIHHPSTYACGCERLMMLLIVALYLIGSFIEDIV